MSYLLRNNRKNKKTLGAKPPSASRLLPRTSSGLRSAGGGQMQLQRPAATTTQQNQSAAVAVTPQQQTRVQGVISMEDVLADLRILEQQQHESERKLQQARSVKERRLKQQAEVEATLDKLKYENGQHRAELESMHKLLSEGQRHLNAIRLKAGKSGEGLREYERKLKMAIQVKRTTAALVRKTDTLLEAIHKKLAVIERLVQEAQEQADRAQKEYDKVKTHEESLRDTIKHEAAKQQRIAAKTNEVRAESTIQEKELDMAYKLEAELKTRMDDEHKKSAEERARYSKIKEATDAKLDQYKKVVEETAAKKRLANDATAQKKRMLHEIWHRTIEIQKAEGHTPSPPPSESNRPPVLDLERIRASVKAEAEAAKEEAKAKEDLQSTVESLRLQLADLKAEQSQASEKAKEIVAANEKARQIETQRKKDYSQILAELKQIRLEVDDKTQLNKQRQAAEESEIAAIEEERDDVLRELAEAREHLSDLRQQETDTDANIAKIEADIEEAKQAYEETRDEQNEQLTAARQRYAELEAEASRIAKDRHAKSKAATKEQKKYQHEVKQVNQKIAKMFEKYPELEKVKFCYNPELSAEKQAKVDLKDIRARCKERINNAKKAWEAVEKQNAEKRKQREMIDKQNAIEAERRKEARKRRTLRIEREPPTTHISQGEDSFKTQLTKEDLEEVEMPPDTSAAKPRALMPSFTQASEEPDEEPADDAIPGDDAEMEQEQPDETFGADLTQPPMLSQPDPTLAQTQLSSTQEKKVHWKDDGTASGSEGSDNEAEETATAPAAVIGKKRRNTATFGSSATASFTGSSNKLPGTALKKKTTTDRKLTLDASHDNVESVPTKKYTEEVTKAKKSRPTYAKAGKRDKTTAEESTSLIKPRVSSKSGPDKVKKPSYIEQLERTGDKSRANKKSTATSSSNRKESTQRHLVDSKSAAEHRGRTSSRETTVSRNQKSRSTSRDPNDSRKMTSRSSSTSHNADESRKQKSRSSSRDPKDSRKQKNRSSSRDSFGGSEQEPNNKKKPRSTSHDSRKEKSHSRSAKLDIKDKNRSGDDVRKQKSLSSSSSDGAKKQRLSSSTDQQNKKRRSSSHDSHSRKTGPDKQKKHRSSSSTDVKKKSSSSSSSRSKSILPALKTTDNRPSGQTSGISSQERGPTKVSRRRKQTAASKSSQLGGFGDDFDFNFNK